MPGVVNTIGSHEGKPSFGSYLSMRQNPRAYFLSYVFSVKERGMQHHSLQIVWVASSKPLSFLSACEENPQGDEISAWHGIYSPLMFGQPNNQGAEIGEIRLS